MNELQVSSHPDRRLCASLHYLVNLADGRDPERSDHIDNISGTHLPLPPHQQVGDCDSPCVKGSTLDGLDVEGAGGPLEALRNRLVVFKLISLFLFKQIIGCTIHCVLILIHRLVLLERDCRGRGVIRSYRLISGRV